MSSSLLPIAIASNNIDAVSQGWKRKGSDYSNEDSSDSEDDETRRRKVICMRKERTFFVRLKSESPLPTDEDDESIHSAQEKETEYARDTSDTSTQTFVSSSDNESVSMHLEYEVASLSEPENDFADVVSSSDPEHDIVTVGLLTAICDSDLGLADDSDDSRSSVDSEIGKADYWTCVQCNTRNNNPLFRYCEKCYQLRKNFFPPRPRRRKRRYRRDSVKRREKSANKHEITATDSGLGSSQGSTKSSFSLDLNLGNAVSSSLNGASTPTSTSVTPDSAETPVAFASIPTVFDKNGRFDEDLLRSNEEKKNHPGHGDDDGGGGRSPPECVSIEKPKEVEVEEEENAEPGEKSMCLICTVNPKNGAFIHGRSLHICCCYKCAIKVWRTTKHCPVCNRRITNVLTAFYT